ncbi:MAG TPA: diguanylate cyclase [Alphaproteobacteria bacterium]|nr:diguanylate cyclase [Alphaproteobacteria bacterium]
MTSKITEFFSKVAPHSFATSEERKVYYFLIDQAFYKSLLSIWTSIGVGFLVYSGLLLFKHDWGLHLWIVVFVSFYLIRLLMYYLYFKSNFLTDQIKQKRFSPIQILFWGALSGLVWVLLFFIIRNYPYEAKIFSIFPLVLFSLGVQSRYSLLPMWYLAYISVIVIPLCLWLFLEGGSFAFWGLGILLYAFYTIIVVYSYFLHHFDTIILRLQNEKLLLELNSTSKKIELQNNELIMEIKRRKEVEKKLAKSATHDSLTGLPNRFLLEDRLKKAILTAKRKGNFLGVLFIDLDRFKLINDIYGHEMGDKLLQAVAKRLRKTFREADTIARMGGDEFIVLLLNLEQEKDIYPIAEKVVKTLSAPYLVKKHVLICPGSAGISLYPTGGTTFEELIRHADNAMYEAKNEGGARVSSYNPKKDNS